MSLGPVWALTLEYLNLQTSFFCYADSSLDNLGQGQVSKICVQAGRMSLTQ